LRAVRLQRLARVGPQRGRRPAARYRLLRLSIKMGNEQSVPVDQSVPPVAEVLETGGDVTTLLTKQDVFLYLPGPRPSAEGWTADSWGLGNPAGVAYLHLTAGEGGPISCGLWQREDQTVQSARLKAKMGAPLASGGPMIGARAPLAAGHSLLARGFISVSHGRIHSGLEAVRDSSRYFVLTLRGEGGRSGVLGFGFADREAAFALKSAIQDYAARVARHGLQEPSMVDSVDTGRGGEGTPPVTSGPSEFSLPAGGTLVLDLGQRGRDVGRKGLRLAPPPPPPTVVGGAPLPSAAPAAHAPPPPHAEEEDEFGELESA
jgi:hypothetical protein